ncbi:S-layer family protein [Natranaerovirga pectinivora]|uniref:S-layer family protein n=1 Tax=Natranaerovirga pectinivora TaxID=682400 RepID=A0A4R3MMN0_9FIRM|nr:S-layer homology domain-containing protein [Natranaerovirga pectinivora]TCT16229.1 S-layer family protein [Natranaerovirga pectinivora]
MICIKKLITSKPLVALILLLTSSSFNVFAEKENLSIAIQDLLPHYNNFNWSYFGITGYGHDMSIASIIKNDDNLHYYINGNVHDMSSGESNADFSLSLEYIVESDTLIQIKEEETMLDSEFDRIELIRTPLVQGTHWTQEVEKNGTLTTLSSTITDVEVTNEGTIFTVIYEDTNSSYYEKRQLQEGIGVIDFEKVMYNNEDEEYMVNYSLFTNETGLDTSINFKDTSRSAWYMPYVSKLITLDLLHGYPDQTFRPNKEITVAEFLKLTILSLSYNLEAGDDIWFNPYIEKSLELDIISNDTFDDYNRPITREEMTKVIVNALGKEPQWGELDFTDADEIDSEYVPYVYIAIELGFIQGYPSYNTFALNQFTTRAEAAKLFAFLAETIYTQESLSISNSLDLENEFQDRLFQETEEGWVVRDFNNKQDLIDYIAEIADRELVETYVNNYYDYIDGELVLIPKDGPTLIIEDREYQLEIITPKNFQLKQETTTDMIGHYTLTITFHYEDNRWIVTNRHVNVQD